MTPSGSFSVMDTVKNQGNASAGASTTRYYLSTTTAKTSSSVLLTGSRSLPSLAAGATSSVAVMNPTPGGGTSSGQTFTINNPLPTATSLSPSSATAGGAAFTLTVTGKNFVSASKVEWKGTGLTTTFVSATKLTALVPASDIATAGTASVTVMDPTPGGGTSSGLAFTIN